MNLNLEDSNRQNKELLEDTYKDIQNKINENYYNSSNVNEYLQDYENFIYTYNNRSIGKNKLKILIDFLNENKTDFIRKFINVLENENKEKLNEVKKKLEESKKLKENVEEEYKNLNEKTEENSKKIEDLNSAIEKKKREIKTLNDEIERVENEIKKVQASDNSDRNINTNNNSMNGSNEDINKQKI